MSGRHDASSRAAQRGAGIMETMIGIVIGLLVVLVVYNMLSVAEGYKRSTTGLADAQVTGLLAHFIVSQDASNGGSGTTSAFENLATCGKDESGAAFTADNTLLPIGLLITEAGVTAKDSDSFVVRQSSSPHVTWAVPLRLVGGAAGVPTVPPGGDIQVQSPNGFMTPGKASLPTAAKQWWAVMVANDNTGRCGLVQIENATPDAAMDTTGEVLLKQGSVKTTIDYKGIPQNDTGTGAFLLNLGRDEAMRRVRYEVNPTNPAMTATSQQNQLLVTDCSDPATGCAAGTRNPIAQNVVLMKLQYGIDTTINAVNADVLDGTVDCWTPGAAIAASAGGSTCPVAGVTADWTAASIIAVANANANTSPPTALNNPLNTKRLLNRILAVRIGLVVVSDEPDMRDASLFAPTSSTIDGTVGTRQPVYLFNCTANTDAGCPNRVLLPAGAGTGPGANNCRGASNSVLCDGYRYRTYEVVIPLRNNIFSATLP